MTLMTTSECPDRQRLQSFLLGLVDGPEAEYLERHLNQCPDCGQTLAVAAGGDTLTTALRGAAAIQTADAAEISGLMQRLRGLTSAGARLAVLPESENFLSLLGPPTREGEIGRLGRCRVLGMIGSGGMGVVFEGEDEQLQRRVALKAIRPSLAQQPGVRQRFLREARAAAAIEHEHIVTIYQVDQQGDVIFLAMQLLAGELLADRLHRDGLLPLAETLRIGREIAAGLAAAHERGLVHRDIKPENLWLDKRGHVKILDFGLARLRDDVSSLTSSDLIIGTPNYMAPEQASGQEIDHRCDLYSLGAVLYRLLTGRPPAVGKNVTAVLLALAKDEPPSLRSLRPDLPAELDQLVRTLLAKNPDQRPATAQVVLQSLASIERTPVGQSRPRAWLPWTWLLATAALVAGIAAAVALVRVATDRGEIVVDTGNDPQVKVAIENGHILIRNRKRDRTYELSVARQPLPSGEYELEVSEAGGLSFQTRQFRINPGKTTTMRAWIAAPMSDPKPRLTIVKVPATTAWTATGIHLKGVSEVAISATGTIQASDGSRIYYHDVPPEGREERLPQFPFPTLPGLALIGRIGDGPAFYIGKELHIKSTVKEGNDELLLGINDDLVDDNSGHWTVQITTRISGN